MLLLIGLALFLQPGCFCSLLLHPVITKTNIKPTVRSPPSLLIKIIHNFTKICQRVYASNSDSYYCIITVQVACGEKFTLVLTQDGTNVFGFGVRGSGQFGRDNWTPKEVFVPVVSSCIVVT